MSDRTATSASPRLTATSTAGPTSWGRSAGIMTYESHLALSTILSLHSVLTELRYKLPLPPSEHAAEGTAVSESELKSAIGGWLHSTITRIGQTRGDLTEETRFTHTGVEIGETTSDDDAVEKLYKLTGLADITDSPGYKERGAQKNAELLVRALERDVNFVRQWKASKSAKDTSERLSNRPVFTPKDKSSRPKSSRSSWRSGGRDLSSRYPTTAAVLGVGALSALTAYGLYQWYTSSEE